jgi:tetratricopeptide (TPR) repeat protein
MSPTPCWALIGLLLVLVGPMLAQAPSDREKPLPLEPKKPVSRAELDRREARRLYAQGLLDERKNRLVEAVRALESAARLDPDAAAIPRALAPLYLALDRGDDAVAACRRTLELEPNDYQTGYLLGRQLRGLDHNDEAITVLKKTAKSKKLAERPDQAAQIWYDLGLLQEKLGKLPEAEKSLRKVVSLLDDVGGMIESGRLTREEVVAQSAETCERIGRICLKEKAIDRAILAFKQAQAKDTLRRPRLAYNLAQVYNDQGKYGDALNQLEIYLQSEPQGIEGYELKINLQRKLRKHADIVPDLAAAANRDSNNLPLNLLLAREYRKAGRNNDAEALYKKLLERTLNPDIYRGLFELYKSQGQAGAERILTMLDTSLDRAAGDDKKQGNATDAANARAMLAVLRDESDLVKQILEASILRMGRRKLSYPARAILATLAGRTKQLDIAEKLYRGCLDRPGGLGTMETEVYAGLLEVLQLRYDHAAIIEISKQGLATAQQTNRVLFHRALVYAYLHLDKFKEALAAANDAVNDSAKAQILGSRKLKVYALSEAGKHEEAVAECQAMLKEYNQGSELREVRLTLSRALLQMGKHDESDHELELILESDPNDATACNDLGYHWADRNKKLDEAEKLVRKAIDLDRKQRQGSAFPGADGDVENAAFIDSLGWVFFRQGKLAEARAELERASKLPTGDDDPVVFDHLGDVYFRTGEKSKALTAWKQALSLYEKGSRRRSDGRHKEIEEKVRLLRSHQ